MCLPHGAILPISVMVLSRVSLQNKHPHVIYEYSDTSTQGCAVTEGFGGVPGTSGGGVMGGGYGNNRQKRRTGGSDPVQDVKDFLKANAAAVKPSDGVAFEVKQRRQSGSNAYPTFIELALIIDKAMVLTFLKNLTWLCKKNNKQFINVSLISISMS